MEPEIHTVIRKTWLSRRPPLGAFLLGSMLTFFLVAVSGLYWHIEAFSQAMVANRALVFEQGEFWRAWGAVFAHADAKHVLSNSVFFFVFGSLLLGYFGPFVFPFFAVVFGGIINLLALQGMPAETQILGASGMVFWMGGAWLAMYFCLDIKRTPWQRSLRAMGVALTLFFPAEAFEPQISYRSHFLGLFLGIGFGLIYYRIKRKMFLSAVVKERIIEESALENGLG